MLKNGNNQNASSSEGTVSNARGVESSASGNSASGNHIPAISIPKGGGAIRGIGEKLSINPVNGTAALTVPLAISPGRSGFGPQLSLSYDSGAGNGPFGFGWSLSLPVITRKTDKGLPRYWDSEESDVFVLSGAEDLVPILAEANGEWQREILPTRILDGESYRVQRYRPRIEGLFSRVERWTKLQNGESHWRSITRDNVTTIYGKDNSSRIFDSADSNEPKREFSWLICQSYDDRGNAINYEYAAEDDQKVDRTQANERNRARTANRYLKRIKYGNKVSHLVQPDLLQMDWMFEAIFDYEEGHYKEVPVNPLLPGAEQHQFVRASTSGPVPWAVRPDPFSSYRSGFEVRTYRRCKRVLMFHHFDELATAPYLVRSTELEYADFDYLLPSTIEQQLAHQGSSRFGSFLCSITQCGFVRDDTRAVVERDRAKYVTYVKKSLPPLEFEYSKANIQENICELDESSLENLPVGLDGSTYQWVDLEGEGVTGILTEQANGWFYKPNLGNGRFGPLETVASIPSVANLSGGRQQLLDLAGNGHLDLVSFADATPGFYERTESEGWDEFRAFTSLPNISWDDPNLRFVDLSGDGHADILITEDEVITWYPSLAEEGFDSAEYVRKPVDEERGPRLVLADGTQSLYLADMCGDGLTALVRIRNGEVCYWPNLGYGRFGAKVTMDNSPRFDSSDQFSQHHIRLADIDGSGTTDIIYLGRTGVSLYFNQSGNRWSEPRRLRQCPRVDDLSSVTTVDLFGNGTACLVWSSSLPGDIRRPLRYIDLMGGQKPHLLIGLVNNLGVEIKARYAPSTKFYLADKRAGRPWLTKIPFAVHVIESIETYDHVNRNRFVTRHAYHHGNFDGEEREFRGFGLVETWDTEEIGALKASGTLTEPTNIDESSYVPPTYTKTWFHTGVYLGRNHVSDFFSGMLSDKDGEYYREPGLSDADAAALLLDDTVLPVGWSVKDEREACRALKGAMLRQEVYALDGTFKEKHPYVVTEQNFTIVRLQSRANNPYGVFFTHPRETLNYHYERNPTFPRVEQALTLEVDAFGNVLRSLAVGYGRRAPNQLLSGPDQQRQSAVLITYTETAHTNVIDQQDAYRAPLPCDVQTYELTGFVSSGRFSFDEWVVNNFAWLQSTAEIAYEDAYDATQQQKRLIERITNRYRSNDLAAVLPHGVVESLAIPNESYKLAFTRGMLASVYRRTIGAGPEENLMPDPALVLSSRAGNGGGYVDLFADGQWWLPSGRAFFDVNADAADPAVTAVTELAEARTHFFRPRKYLDAFDAITTVQYDVNDLLTVRTTDAVGNTIGALPDYRVLQPRLVTDPNGNRSEAVFNALGLVVGTAVRGKLTENLGDRLVGFEPDLSQAQLDAFFWAVDPHGPGSSLLADATTRIVYDHDRFRRTRAANPNDPSQWQPTYAATLSREIHVRDLQTGQQSRISISVTYSNGFGHEIQKKVQAEPGPLHLNGPVVSPRWVGSGWTIFNNKGKPVRQYEPFFSGTHEYEFAQLVGVSPVVFYDPLGRVVAALHPDHGWEKCVFEAWRQENWDAGDTVLISDPKNDADVADFFRRLPDADYLPSWYAVRQGGALGPEEQAAADKASMHAATPAVVHFDSLGRKFLMEAQNRFKNSNSSLGDPPTVKVYLTRSLLDVEGNQREVIDAKDRVVMRCDYDMVGRGIHSVSMDAGERWILRDIAGMPIYSWDHRDHRLRNVYDRLRRPTDTFLREGFGAEVLVGRSIYGETQPNPEMANLRGRVVRLLDQSGVAISDEYDFKGNLLHTQRQLARDYKATLNWSNNVPLDPEIYSSRTRFDAFNRPIEITAPDESVIRPGYNEASLLEQVEVNHRRARQGGQMVWTPFVTGIDYNARGQRQRISYGNGATTNYVYDPNTFRLTRLSTTRGSAPADLQDLSYTYDPVGNITAIRDSAQPTIYFNNQVVTASANYEYDSLHRLTAATGREHLGQTGSQLNASVQPGNDEGIRINHAHPADGNAMGAYVERYDYDAVGNILKVLHVGASNGWTRRYDYEPNNNRLRSTSLPGDLNAPFSARYVHDAHGNMIQMPHLAQMIWDFRDNLHEVDLGGGGHAYFVYDAAGQRTRKVWEKSATLIEERLYLGAFEIFRRRNAGVVTRERQTLHVLDGDKRVVMVETKTIESGAVVPAPVSVTRYQFGNQLGSVALELDESGAIISYEEYFPYGGTSFQTVSGNIEVSLKRYRYQGKERDEETGLDYFGARHYASWLGRWASADPAGGSDGPNLYQFVRSNPLVLTDPSGTQSEPSGWSKLSNEQRAAVEAHIRQSMAEAHALFPHAVEISGSLKQFSVTEVNGMRTVSISYDINVIDHWDTINFDGRTIPKGIGSVIPAGRSWNFPIPVDDSTAAQQPAAMDEHAAATRESASDASAEHPSESESPQSSSAPHEAVGLKEWLERLKSFFETAEKIEQLADPIIEYLEERFSKLGKKLEELGEVPWIKKTLKVGKKLLKHATNVLTGILSVVDAVTTGSLKPILEGAGEIFGGLIAGAVAAAIGEIAIDVMVLLEAEPILIAAAGLAVAALVIWAAEKGGEFVKRLGGEIYEAFKAFGSFLERAWDETTRNLNSFILGQAGAYR